jgi:short-subunit dehydrogenase
VVIGSVPAHQAFANNAAYVASKHGLAGPAGGTFLDLRNLGVKVSLVSPRWSPRKPSCFAHRRRRAGTDARPC